MHLKLLQEKPIHRTAEVTGDSIGNKIADVVLSCATMKLQKFQEIDYRTFQRHLEVKQKYLKKDIYFQKKNRELLKTYIEYNNVLI